MERKTIKWKKKEKGRRKNKKKKQNKIYKYPYCVWESFIQENNIYKP
jgi:hypothetical protein